MRTTVFKAIAVSAFTVVAAISAASAADMAPRYTKAPPPVVEVWTWDKIYVGLNGGFLTGVWSADDCRWLSMGDRGKRLRFRCSYWLLLVAQESKGVWSGGG